MGKLTNLISEIGFSILVLGVSGCSGGFETYNGFSNQWQPSYQNKNIPKINIRDCRYKSELLKRAEILSKSDYTSNKIEAAVLYGEFCELEKMDRILKKIMNNSSESNNVAFKCAEIGEKYYKLCESFENKSTNEN